MSSNMKPFPELKEHTWRSDWPFLATLKDGKRIPAYPILGLINDDNNLCFGEACKEKMWMLTDDMIEHVDIIDVANGRYIPADKVLDWESLE